MGYSCKCALAAVVLLTSGIGYADAAEKARIFGVVETRGHAEVLAKWAAVAKASKAKIPDYTSQGVIGSSIDRSYNEGDEVAINYQDLGDIFVVLSHAPWQGGVVHEVELSTYGLNVEVLAVAKGDTIRLHNNTNNPYTPYLAGTGDDDIQDFPTIAPGSVNDLVVDLTGELELGLDEDDEETIIIAAGIGWKSHKVKSGDAYEFKDLEGGSYNLMFWYWRLGRLGHKLSLNPGEAVELNEVLSVDRIVK
jgi:hypothetical protein